MEKLLLRPMEAADTLGVSRSRIYEWIASGDCPGVVWLGRSVRLSSDALRAWVREQAAAKTEPAA